MPCEATDTSAGRRPAVRHADAVSRACAARAVWCHECVQYLDLVKDLIENGQYKPDRTGTGTFSKFGCMARYNLRHSFPMLTTKRVFWKGEPLPHEGLRAAYAAQLLRPIRRSGAWIVEQRDRFATLSRSCPLERWRLHACTHALPAC